MPGIGPTGKIAGTKKETPGVEDQHEEVGNHRNAFSFWDRSTIPSAFVERVPPVASFLFPLPRHTLVNQTLAINAPTAFFTRLRRGQALRQASHHAGKEAFENSHGVPHISNSSCVPFRARSSENLVRVVDAIGKNVRFGMTAVSTSPPAIVAALANGSLLAVTRAIVTCSSRLTPTS